MFKFESPLRQLVFSFGAGCVGLCLGALMSRIPLVALLAVGSVGILAMLWPVLRESDCSPTTLKRTMVALSLALLALTFGVPYIVSMERTLFIADSHPHHWGRKGRILVFPNNKTIEQPFGNNVQLLTPVVGHGRPKETLAPSELILDIDSRITVATPTIWRPLDPVEGYRRYWYEMPEVRFGFPKGPNEMLQLTFPSEGEYKFRWKLRGSGISPIDRSFKIRLVEPNQ